MITLEQLKKIIISVLKQWFSNKKVLDNFKEVNKRLYYNNIQIIYDTDLDTLGDALDKINREIIT